MIQDLSASWRIEGTDESILVMDSSVSLMTMIHTDLESLIQFTATVHISSDQSYMPNNNVSY